MLNILIDSSSLNILSSSFLHLTQIIERTKVFSKMYDILGFLNFLCLPQITQHHFFHLDRFSYWNYLSIILLFFHIFQEKINFYNLFNFYLSA